MPLTIAFRSGGPDEPFLLETACYTDSDVSTPYSDGPPLRRSAGVNALLELALRTRIAFAEDHSGPAPELTGNGNSGAAALYKACNEPYRIIWPAQIFGTHARFTTCLNKSSRGPRENRLYRAAFDADVLPAGAIDVRLDGRPVGHDAAALRRIARGLFGLPEAAQRQRLRLAILRSGELAYTREIARGLTERLRELNYVLDPGRVVDWPGPELPPYANGALAPEWQLAIDTLFERGQHGFDFLVAVGTQAAAALREKYGDDFGLPGRCPPVVFLGVTYPIAAQLIDSLFSRREPREVCGVAYGADGLRSIAALIHNWLLPGPPLKYVYFADHPQDLEAAEQLRRTRLFARGGLHVCEATPETLAAAVADPDAVYFSWYTFETIFEARTAHYRELAQLLRARRVVATTRLNCEHGLTFAAVAADDAAIGRHGADLIHGRLDGDVPHLGRRDVIIPQIGYWVNARVAAEKGVALAAEVPAGAWGVFD